VLVLPEVQKMKVEILQKIEELLDKGATIIGPRPTRVYGLSDYEAKEVVLNEIADKIWGKSKKTKNIDKKYGKGRIVWGKTAREILREKGIGPDLQYIDQAKNPVLDYIHRTTDQEEIYFIRNTDPQALSLDVTFRITNLNPELWDPISGEMTPLPVYKKEQGGIRLPLDLTGFGSIFIVFRKTANERKHIQQVDFNGELVFPAPGKIERAFQVVYIDDNSIDFSSQVKGQYRVTFNNGKTATVESSGETAVTELSGSWDVRFPAGWGPKPVQNFEELIDWTSSEVHELKHFSGIATYRKDFTITKDNLSSELFTLNLGQVGAVPRVFLNGKLVGISLFPPHSFDVSSFLKEGENHLVVEVANTWLNRLVGDLDLPADMQFTRSNVTTGNDPSNRPWAGSELQPSGLIGPVKLKKNSGIRLDTEIK
jgi:hypothetical protein